MENAEIRYSWGLTLWKMLKYIWLRYGWDLLLLKRQKLDTTGVLINFKC